MTGGDISGKYCIRCRYGADLWRNHFPLRVMRHERHHSREMHSHDFWELTVIMSGSCTHLVPEGEFYISTGNIFLLSPGMKHGYAARKDFSLINLLYGANLMPRLDIGDSPGFKELFELNPLRQRGRGFAPYLKLSADMLRELDTRIAFLETTLNEKRPGMRFHSLALFMDIVYRISEYFSMPDRQDNQDGGFKLEKLLGYITRNLGEDITIRDMARMMAVSEATLYRTFIRELGEAPMTYLNRRRIAHAQMLLLNTRNPISHVALDVGIPDFNYFSRFFRRFTGMTPREFRNRNGSRSLPD